MNNISEDFAKNVKFFTQKQVPKAVSIYLPTNKEWTETDKDRIELKKAISRVEDELERHEVRTSDIKDILKPLKKLYRNEKFWKEQSRGLAIFTSENFFKHYRIDLEFEPLTVIQDYFYITPLATLLETYPDYYVMAVSQKHVKLYKGSYNKLSDPIKETLPKDIQEALWHDDEEKDIQRRTGAKVGPGNPRGATMFHGSQTKNDMYKNKLTRFARKLNKDFNDKSGDRSLPLIIASVDYFFPIYRGVNTYPELLETNISGNPDELSLTELSEKAWGIILSTYGEEIDSEIKRYRNMLHTRRTLTNIRDIVTSSYQARIEALFVEQDKQIWGNFQEEDNKVVVKPEREPDDEELLNLSLINTLRNGGKIYPLNKVGDIDKPYAGILRF
jgi:hypothetical protein